MSKLPGASRYSSEVAQGTMPMIALPVRDEQVLIKSNGSLSGSLFQTHQNLPHLNLSMMDDTKPSQQPQPHTHHADLQRLQEQIRNLSDLMKVL